MKIKDGEQMTTKEKSVFGIAQLVAWSFGINSGICRYLNSSSGTGSELNKKKKSELVHGTY